jgi:hypothetical protein
MSVIDSVSNTNSFVDSNGNTVTTTHTEFTPDNKTVGIAAGVGTILILPTVLLASVGIYLIYRLTKH